MSASQFYVTDPGDPAAPVVLAEYTGPHYGTIRPGNLVTYDNPHAPGLGNPTPDGGPMTVTELLRFPALPGREDEYTVAVLDSGAFECAADHLRRVALAEFPSIKAFYADRPEREASPESDYGVCWRADGKGWPVWRVSYVQATGEVYAFRQGGSPVGPVRVLAVVQPDPDERDRNDPRRDGRHYYRTLNRILDGWADPDVSGFDLAWIERRLAEHKGGQDDGQDRPQG